MIPVYKYEQKDGIVDLIQANASIAYTSSVRGVEIEKDQLTKLKKFLESSASANPNQFDLYYLESVLASIGWNQNDDVFDKFETWKARSTPVDKQFNFMHSEKDIIGHLTSSKLVNLDGVIISESTPFDELPDSFDIVVGSVLYKKWSDPVLQERMLNIISEIEQDKWCVSMECMFKDFDYAIKSDSTNKVLARDDETSFLTKHLRIYGGTGEYGGYKIGRLLRNFTFSGKGLVDNPANPRSHITSFNGSSETTVFVSTMATAEELSISKEEKQMANEIVYTKEQYESLKAELDQFKTASEEAQKKEIDSLKAQITELTNTVKTLSSELEASKEVSNAKEDKVISLEKELAEANAKIEETEKSIKEAEAKALNAARKALLLERVDEEKAENLVQKFANASQEMFDALVDSLPIKSDSKAKEDKEKEEDEEDCEAEVKTNIDNAKADDNIEMSSGSTQEEETISQRAAAWLMSNVLRTTQKDKSE